MYNPKKKGNKRFPQNMAANLVVTSRNIRDT